MKKQHGLTLVELMVTLAVVTILFAAGMPLFNGVVANNRAVSQANTFMTAFKLARSEAIRRGSQVSVCAIDDPAATTPTCGTSGNWNNGLLVFSDTGTLGSVDGSDDQIRTFLITTAGSSVSATGAFVRFQAQGEVANMTANAACSTSGTCLELDHTGTSGAQRRCLYVMNSGQVRLQKGSCV